MFEGMWHVSLRCSVIDERRRNEARGKGWLQEMVRDKNVTIKQRGDVSVWSGFGGYVGCEVGLMSRGKGEVEESKVLQASSCVSERRVIHACDREAGQYDMSAG